MSEAPSPTHQHTMRTRNQRSVVLELIRTPGSRADLAVRTGLTKATVASLVEPLISARVLAENGSGHQGRGRPSRTLTVHPQSPVAVGAEINVTHLAVTAMSLDGEVIDARRIESDNRALSVEHILARLAEVVVEVVRGCDRPVLGAGLAVPGTVRADVVGRSPNLPQLTGSRPGPALAALVGITEVVIDNEANLAAHAHLWPHPTIGRDFVYVSGDVGVGAGLVTDGAVYRGTLGFAGELGHVVVDWNGPDCSCGGRGCVEQYAGSRAVLRAAKRRTLNGLATALAAGDANAAAAVETAARALGVGLASLVNVFDVPTVVIGGVLARALYPALVPALTAELERRVLAAQWRMPTIIESGFDEKSAVRGAAGLITHRACMQPQRLTDAADPGNR